MTQEYIAVLGYGENCSAENLDRAFQAGRNIVMQGYAVCAGNVAGTFRFAFEGAKSMAGNTMAILDKSYTEADISLCDTIFYADDAAHKHRMIAQQASAAIVIGGGAGTMQLIDRLLAENKLVAAIRNSGGVADSQPDRRVKIVADIETAMNYIIDTSQR